MRSVCFWLFFGIASACNTAKSADLYCWIVADDDGATSHSCSTITNNVAELNKIFTQVAMSFSVQSVTYTNSTYLTNIVFTNKQQIAELCSITNGTSGLEVYFVESITDRVAAFCGESGIAVAKNYNRTTLAHEVGHACGLADIYDAHQETTLVVTGMPRKVWMPCDWGWYPENFTQVDAIKRLLMYGYNTSTKGDISRGDVYGLSCEYTWNTARNDWDKSWWLGMTSVGFKDHGNRHPVSQ